MEGIKLIPVEEEEDTLNNYSEFKQKSVLNLKVDAAGYCGTLIMEGVRTGWCRY